MGLSVFDSKLEYNSTLVDLLIFEEKCHVTSVEATTDLKREQKENLSIVR